jgi:hypothetical protein
MLHFSMRCNCLPFHAAYVSSLPASAHPHLDRQLDWDNQINKDLIEIALHMLHWEVRLRVHLGLTDKDVHDIKANHSNSPELQR